MESGEWSVTVKSGIACDVDSRGFAPFTIQEVRDISGDDGDVPGVSRGRDHEGREQTRTRSGGGGFPDLISNRG